MSGSGRRHSDGEAGGVGSGMSGAGRRNSDGVSGGGGSGMSGAGRSMDSDGVAGGGWLRDERSRAEELRGGELRDKRSPCGRRGHTPRRPPLPGPRRDWAVPYRCPRSRSPRSGS